MRKNNVTTGLFLILIAAIMMGSAMGLIPNLPWFRLICATALTVWAIKALFKSNFLGAFFSASIVAWIFEKELMIEHLTPFPLVVAAILVGLGLNMIIGKRKKIISYEYTDKNGQWKENTINDVKKEEWKEGREVVLKNNFNSTSKYVNSVSFSSAKLENNFGSANVYFTNANVWNGQATIDLENNFGRMNIYLPGKWRANISQDSTFGHINIHGEPNRDMDAPVVIVKAESNFGELNIYFD